MCPTDRERKAVRGRNLEPLEEAFRGLDKDGDGIIATSDLKLFLEKLVAFKLISKEDVEKMLELGDDNVDFEQFLNLLRVQESKAARSSRRAENDEDLRTMFDSLDRNGDGFICADDLNSLKGVLGRALSETDIEGMLSRETWMTGPEDHPKVTYEEFVKLMIQQRRVKSKGLPLLRACRY